MYYSFKNVVFGGNCVKGTQDISVLFLTSACEFAIISIKFSIKNFTPIPKIKIKLS